MTSGFPRSPAWMSTVLTHSQQSQIIPWTIEALTFPWRGQNMVNNYWAWSGSRFKAGGPVYNSLNNSSNSLVREGRTNLVSLFSPHPLPTHWGILTHTKSYPEEQTWKPSNLGSAAYLAETWANQFRTGKFNSLLLSQPGRQWEGLSVPPITAVWGEKEKSEWAEEANKQTGKGSIIEGAPAQKTEGYSVRRKSFLLILLKLFSPSPPKWSGRCLSVLRALKRLGTR